MAREKWRRIPDEIKEQIAFEYVAGLTMPQLAERYDTTAATVCDILKKFNIPARHFHESRRKYHVNEDAFANAESSDAAAYHIGYLMADGCISDTNRGHRHLCIGLSAKDICHVESLLSFLESDYPIYRKTFTRNTGHVSKMVAIQIPSDDICDDLERYGVTPRKTTTAKFHDSLAFNRHAYRGLVDGDGCLGLYRNRKDKEILAPQISLWGSWDITHQFCDFIERELGFRLKAYPRPGCYVVQTAGRKAQQVVRLLYEGCDSALPRKLAIAKGVMSLDLSRARTKNSHIGPETIHALYEQYRSWVDVAAALDITPSGLSYLRRKFAVQPTVRSRHIKVADLNREDMVALREEYGTWAAAARHMGASIQTVCGHATSLGLYVERPAYHGLSDEELRDLLAYHGTVARMARALNVHWSNVGNLLESRGIEYKGWKINKVTREELEALYREHGKWLRVARHLGVTDGAVYYLRKRLGMLDWPNEG